MKKKKWISSVLTAAMLLALCVPASSYAASFSDARGHWAESYIDKAVSHGFVNGYPDGTFRPDNSVSRAEFATMINKALGNTGTASITFTDVPHNEWYYNDISKALAATYVAGYDDNTFQPNSPITRQEAAVIISRIVPSYGVSGNLRTYSDYASVADWAQTAFQKANGKGYLGAYDDGKIHPLDKLTRAQTAKIICDILAKEKIVKSDPIVKTRGTKLSDTIYSNGVTVHRDLGNESATIENCIILGSLSVQGGSSNTVTVSNSRVAGASVERSADVVRLLVKGESLISSLSAARSAIIQTSALPGGLYGNGINNLNILSSSDITLQGTFPKVNVSGTSAKLTIESGSVTNLVVSSNAKGSEITVDSTASVGTVDVDAESYFYGDGTITRMNVNANGVTYETKPRTVNVGSRYDDPEEGDSALVSFSPKNGATKVALDTKITITFKTAMKLYDKTTISNDDIEDLVELREKSSSGTYIDYTATINSAKKVITITPDDNFDTNTKYYIIIDKNVMRDADGNGNAAQSVSFTTGTTSDALVTFSPKSGATGVSTGTDPTITFSEAIETYAGKSISSDYLDNSVIVFKENSSSGTNVPFEATINSAKKVITITPDNTLKEDQKYYLGIVTRKLRTQSGDENIAASSVTWTTSTGSNTPSVPRSFTSTPGDRQVALSWTTPSSNGGYTITRYEVSRDSTSSWTSVGTNTSYTYTGLTNGTSYTFRVRAVNSKGAGTAASLTAKPQTATLTVPSVPQNFQAVAGDKQVFLTWTAPSNNGSSAITKYKYSVSTGSTDNWQDVPNSPATTTNYLVSGLTNGTEYTFKVRAVNSAGDGTATSGIKAKPMTAYNITVTGGTASPSTATTGTTVTITANAAPSGKQFKDWTVSPSVSFTGGSTATSATAKFTMPAQAVTVTANFVDIPVTITKVTVDPATAEVLKGAAFSFSASVTGTGNFSRGVAWSVSGQSSTATSISESGKLTVGADETAATLTITATSEVDPNKSGKATVTVTEPPSTPGDTSGSAIQSPLDLPKAE